MTKEEFEKLTDAAANKMVANFEKARANGTDMFKTGKAKGGKTNPSPKPPPTKP